ncbi:cyclic-nucleotide signal transduction protein [Arthrobacter crystallopoietes BAB-32]|uniref:Cyclic-nucleotide signal transduction protein n=1 Tax=Arthrobacter crystallopoietes BAB-32 TaxID=1246476 RepID=N1V4E3_9MICC|nr:putative nucleotidyltransferase substrate binding domain-containing protein [Arthrobacter crystallopoietes]EMY36210.1 cyclic-nucleotide signal transduction protein [Arthrobacter crystallopoietes BAB-32]
MTEYLDFLGSQSPYDSLDRDDLAALGARVEVENFPEGTVIIRADGPPLTHLWVVYRGSVEVVDRGRVVEQLGPGSTFGHISLLTNMSPALSVRAREDCVCLRLSDPRTFLAHPERLRFAHFGTLISRERLTGNAALDRTPGSVRALMRPVIWASEDETAATAARRISEASHSCVLISTAKGTGIVTDRDFRECVATGQVDTNAPVALLASVPALAVRDDASQADAFARMVDSGVHHLVVSSQGGQPVGIIRTVDFASAAIRNPLRIRSAIESAPDLEALTAAAKSLRPTLVELGANGEPGLHIANLMTAVVDAILRKIISLTPKPVETPVSWILLGSIARREPMPRSDVDTALVWDGDLTADEAAEARAYAEAVLQTMEACGLPRCAEGANAVNPLFSRSRSGWQDIGDTWIKNPAGYNALLFSSMVIDSRALTELQLGRALTDTVRLGPQSKEFLHAFMLESLAVHPPAGFFRGLAIGHRGTRAAVDLKQMGLKPIASIGRWIAAATGDACGSTIDRLRRGADAKVLTRDEAETLIGAFEHIYQILLERDIASLTAGTGTALSRVRMEELDSLTRRHLRASFRSVAAIQQSIAGSWSSRLRT